MASAAFYGQSELICFYSQFIQLGLNIANYRKLRKLTQRELAEKVGLPTIRIRNIEFPRKITTPVSLEEIFDIGEALEVKVMKFFDFRE